MHSFLLLQLSFNILILVGLIVLAAGRRSRRKGTSTEASPNVAAFQRPTESPTPQQTSQPPKKAKKPSPPVADGGLDELISQAEQEELVAEGALRRRLERLRAQAAG
jgi:hypothetical protein